MYVRFLVVYPRILRFPLIERDLERMVVVVRAPINT
jgi:hypothetical protein